jgi:hypothetical protein
MSVFPPKTEHVCDVSALTSEREWNKVTDLLQFPHTNSIIKVAYKHFFTEKSIIKTRQCSPPKTEHVCDVSALTSERQPQIQCLG